MLLVFLAWLVLILQWEDKHSKAQVILRLYYRLQGLMCLTAYTQHCSVVYVRAKQYFIPLIPYIDKPQLGKGCAEDGNS